MDPEIWGSHAWIFLHTITLNYPKNPTLYDKKIYKNFFENLDKILPCTWCAHNYRIHMNKYPIQNYLGTKKNLVKWLIIMHNEVNKILKKTGLQVVMQEYRVFFPAILKILRPSEQYLKWFPLGGQYFVIAKKY